MLNVINEYSQFSFAFPYPDIMSNSVIQCLCILIYHLITQNGHAEVLCLAQYDTLTNEVALIEMNPHYVLVWQSDGKESTLSQWHGTCWRWSSTQYSFQRKACIPCLYCSTRGPMCQHCEPCESDMVSLEISDTVSLLPQEDQTFSVQCDLNEDM